MADGKTWAAGGGGVVTVPYRVYPEPPPNSTLTRQQVVDGFRAAADTWAKANPRLRPLYQGTSDQPPGNYNNVVGFGTGCVASPGCVWTKAGDQAVFAPHTTAFHMILSIHVQTDWTWRPCDPEAGQHCSDYPDGAADLQDVATHEWGHVWGLGHVEGDEHYELTMFPRGGEGYGTAERDRITLGLGDVLGIRKLYPCDCPMPVIHRP